MPHQDVKDRVAILLNMLGSEVADPILETLGPEQQERLRERLTQYDQTPPSSEDVDDALDEFEKLFRQVADPQTSLRIAPGTAPDESSCAADAAAAATEPFEMTDDPFADLGRLEPFQIAGALKGEHPRTIALVLNCLPTDKAGQALRELPQETRNEAFLQFNDRPSGSQHMVQRIVRATVQKGCTLDRQSLSSGEAEADNKLAGLLRAMSRTDRQEMLDALEQQDAEAAARVKDLLYVFEDLLIIEDRSLQKILAEVDAATLAMALKDGDEALIDKVGGNLSRRARASLQEEMEFMGFVPPEKQEEAQKTIVDIIARLDQSGDLVMTG